MEDKRAPIRTTCGMFQRIVLTLICICKELERDGAQLGVEIYHLEELKEELFKGWEGSK